MYQQSSRNSLPACLPGIASAALFIVLAGMVVSANAQDAKPTTEQTPAIDQAKPAETELEKLRRLVAQYAGENTRLKADIAKLEKYRQVDYLRDLMTKEENRVLSSQRELADSSSKEAALQKRIDEIDSQLRPGRIEESRAGVGSTKPEADREDIQRQLSNEKRRLESQIDQLKQHRPRLQATIQTAEGSIATLRERLRTAVRTAGLSNTP